MISTGAPLSADLPSVISLLTALIGQTEAGDWEAVVAMQPEVCKQLANLERFYGPTTAARSVSLADRNKMAEIVTLIDKAAMRCAARREQIAPLVNSLKALPDSIRA